MGKSVGLAGLLVVLLGLIVFQYYITAVPDLEAPITVGEARLIKENNSLLVSLSGADGQNFTLGLRGDIAENPEETALFYIRNPELVPYVYWPGLRSNDEKRVLELLGAWAKKHGDSTFIEPPLSDYDEMASQQEMKVAAAYRIYSVLKNRN